MKTDSTNNAVPGSPSLPKSTHSGKTFRLADLLLNEAFPRGIALFLGFFALVNVLGSFFLPDFDASIWWVDLRSLPVWLSRCLQTVCGVALLAFGLRRPRKFSGRLFTIVCAAFIATVSVVNSVIFVALALRGKIVPTLPVPLALVIAGVLLWVVALAWRVPPAPRPGRPMRLLRIAAVAAACFVAFPLAQMFFFGKTDYRRPADVAIVLGARAYADGRPSDALADRVRTACELYKQGYVKKLIFSGGPGDGSVHETESMRNMAVKLGVPAANIILDKHGVNTRATVNNTRDLLEQMHASRVLVVSHFYHLPRLKLTYSRQGREVYTVPARESYMLSQLPFNMAREVVALWVYFLRPV